MTDVRDMSAAQFAAAVELARERMGRWIEPPDPNLAGEWILTRSSADCAPGFDLGLPDLRICYRWNGGGVGRGSWGDERSLADGSATRFCLHSNNGWRLQERAP